MCLCNGGRYLVRYFRSFCNGLKTVVEFVKLCFRGSSASSVFLFLFVTAVLCLHMCEYLYRPLFHFGRTIYLGTLFSIIIGLILMLNDCMVYLNNQPP